MIAADPTPKISCLRCAHAFARSRDGVVLPCPTRDLTGATMPCQPSQGLRWLPLGYAAMVGSDLTPKEAARRAENELRAERKLPPTTRLERRMGTAMTKKDEDKYLKAFEAIDEAATNYLSTLDVNATGMVQTIQRARAIATIRTALSDEIIHNIVRPLEGIALGFLTDRAGDAKGYPAETLRTCLIQAMLHGARIDGNEFNIVKGSPMLVQNYWRRMVDELPGVANLAIDFGAVERNGTEASIECLAVWTLDGEEMRLTLRDKVKEHGGEWDRRIVVPINNNMGRDALIGKALRRVLKMIYERVTGRRIDAMDPDAPIDVESAAAEAPEASAEDPQDVADEQARLMEEYVNLLGSAEDTHGVDSVVKSAEEDPALLPETLGDIKAAGRQRWRQIKADGA